MATQAGLEDTVVDAGEIAADVELEDIGMALGEVLVAVHRRVYALTGAAVAMRAGGRSESGVSLIRIERHSAGSWSARGRRR